MSADPEFPDIPGFDGLDMEEVPDLSAEGEAAPAPAGALRRWQPLIFLGVSLVLAAVAWAVRPRPEDVVPIDVLYKGGLRALRRAMDPELPLSESDVAREVDRARVHFDLLMHHHGPSLGDHPELVNPYMLRADAHRLFYERFENPPARPAEQAVASYQRALDWENRPRAEADPETVRRPYVVGEERVPEAWEYAVRRQRRRRYIQYHRAVLGIDLGLYNMARETLLELRESFQKDELARRASGFLQAGEAPERPGREVLPQDFELVEEDRIRLHYHLGTLHERLGEEGAAERAYRTFLMRASRDRERFLALMQLGKIHAARGRRLRDASTRLPGESAGEAAAVHFQAAIDMFTQIVEASAPGGIRREAYFRGGMALLATAEQIEVGRTAWPHALAESARATARTLEQFAGRPLPEATRALPAAAARLLLAEALVLPDLSALPVQGAAGFAGTLAARSRLSPAEARGRLLARARSFFRGAQGGPLERFNGPARVMIARTLLADGSLERARRLFHLTMAGYPEPEVQVAGRLGLARVFLAEGDLDRARVEYLGGVSVPENSLLQPEDILDWEELCLRLDRESRAPEESIGRRVADMLPPGVRATVEECLRAGEVPDIRRRRILTGMNGLLARRDLAPATVPEWVLHSKEARWLFGRERNVLSRREVERLNRLLLEALFPEVIAPAHSGGERPGLPAADDLPAGLLVTPAGVVRDLTHLARRYLMEADDAERLVRELREGTEALAETRRTERQALRHAAAVNEFLLGRYRPADAEILYQTAEIYAREARVLAGFPFHLPEEARDFTARAGRTWFRVARDVPGGPREEEALLRAGEAFYAAAQYERAVEALEIYGERHGSSDRAGAAANLLGRSYRRLGLSEEALRVFRENAFRRTADGRKALYYLGETLLAMAETDPDAHGALLGDERDPRAPEAGGIRRIRTALQAFNEVRALPGIGPSARPWRWSTFGLGDTWLLMAERTRAAQPGNRDSWQPLYRRAEEALREALDRYVLADQASEAIGIDPAREPADYAEVRKARFVAEYDLARVQEVLETPAEARSHLENLLDSDRYADRMFTEPPTPPVITSATTLGVTEGPTYDPERLWHLRRNAYFLLGQSWYEAGERLREQYPDEPARADEAFARAYAVYQRAHDRLPPRDRPGVIYMMAETLRQLRQDREAANRLVLARNAARTLRAEEGADPFGLSRQSLWQQLAAARLGDLEDGIAP